MKINKNFQSFLLHLYTDFHCNIRSLFEFSLIAINFELLKLNSTIKRKISFNKNYGKNLNNFSDKE